MFKHGGHLFQFLKDRSSHAFRLRLSFTGLPRKAGSLLIDEFLNMLFNLLEVWLLGGLFDLSLFLS